MFRAEACCLLSAIGTAVAGGRWLGLFQPRHHNPSVLVAGPTQTLILIRPSPNTHLPSPHFYLSGQAVSNCVGPCQLMADCARPIWTVPRRRLGTETSLVEPNANVESEFYGGEQLNDPEDEDLIVAWRAEQVFDHNKLCLLYTSPSPRDRG